MSNGSYGEIKGSALVDLTANEDTAVHLRWSDGRFMSVEQKLNAQDGLLGIVPPLFDPQVNGFAGIDFQQDDLSSEQMLHAVYELRKHACSQILLTLITDEWPKLMKRLTQLKKMRDANAELRAAIQGWHIEGPFLSEKPGFCGAHPPELMINPTTEHIAELRAITENDPVLLTLAPERPGAIAAIKHAAQANIVVSLGHTDASRDQLLSAVCAGAKAFTHFGNGCPRTLDRQDNILWRVLNIKELTLGIIPDGIHVTSDLFSIAQLIVESYRGWSGWGGMYYTTDAMAAAGAPPGQYSIGRLKLEVGPDRVVRLPGQSLFAGSALTPLEGIFRATELLGEAAGANLWNYSSYYARKLMGLNTEFRAGDSADFCAIKMDRHLQILGVDMFIRGERTALALPTTH